MALRVSLLAALCSVDGFRSKHKHARASAYIAGVPVINMHLAENTAALSFAQTLAQERDWMIVVNPEATESDLKALCGDAKFCKLVGHPSGGVPFMEVHGASTDLETALGNAPEGTVQFIEPTVRVEAIPEIDGGVQMASSKSWGLERVGADVRPRNGAGVSIYVVDTGVRTTHNDFEGRAVAALDLTSGSVVECTGDGDCAKDVVGHGTHCAGTAAGATFGVASGAQVLSVKVIDDFNGGDSAWSVAALDWIATKGNRPAVVSMSLGSSGVVAAFQVGVDGAVNAGVTVVVAGGNFNKDACGYSPAYVPSAITVGATSQGDVRAEFSNYGSCTDIWAPGEGINSAGYFKDTEARKLSGTSMACPHVSGGAALLLQANPSWKAAEVLASMYNSAINGAVADLKDGDTNKLLWVGAGPAPEPTEATCPTNSTGPDDSGDCRCKSGKRCYMAGGFGCVWSGGRQSSYYHLATCPNCKCMR